MSSNNDTRPGHEEQHSSWDEQWLEYCEMEAGSEDPFPEFADKVREKMEEVGNEVGRPLVMKVKVQATEGEINHPNDEQ